MKPLDKNYISLQFKVKIHSKNGSEFQSFFESIMEKAFSDFQKIRPYGKDGDGGNDGYRKNSGVYYQVYAPNVPSIKEAKAAKKLKDDFTNLKNNWDKISEIKEYYFVFNDKYSGSSQKLEEAISELEKNDPNIKFDTLLAKNLETFFFTLDEADILDLNFNIDSRQAVSIGYEYLQKVEIELDRENAKFASRILENIQDIIPILNDEQLFLEYELLECRCLQKIEKVEEAKDKYDDIVSRYPSDPRATLYLSEIFLQNNDFGKNKELLEKAEKIDNNHWLLKLEKLVRKSHLGKKIDPSTIIEQDFPNEPRLKSSFYRLYAHFLAESGDKVKANAFIGKAINLNKDRFSNYIARLDLKEKDLFLTQDNSNISEEAERYFVEVEKVENRFLEFGDIGNRNKALLNLKKINAYRIEEKYQDVLGLIKETFDLILSCYFNREIDRFLVSSLFSVQLPIDDFNRLLDYLKLSEKEISDDLSKVLITQFNAHNNLFDEGKKFFKRQKKEQFVDFINDLENKDYKRILSFLTDDIPFAISFAHSLKILPDLRIKIIEILPKDGSIQKDKLLLLINCDENNIEDAFEILKQIDLSSLNYLECRSILKIVHEKKAWDFEIIILKKLLEKEQDERVKHDLKLKLFNANIYLERHLEVISIGENILEEDSQKNFLVSKNKEILLAQIVTSYLKRGQNTEAKLLIEKYELQEPTFEFIIGIKVEVYIKTNNSQKAVEAIIEGVKLRKMLSPEDYAKLFHYLMQIENLSGINLESLEKVQDNVFVKLKNQDRWYFIGDENELDASKISKQNKNSRYSLFIEKRVGDKVLFEGKYSSKSSENIIEYIFPIAQYIYWQSAHNFQKLTLEERWEGAWAVEIRNEEGIVDPKYLLAFFEDLDKNKGAFFESYCKNRVPFAMLATIEDGLIQAIGRIQNENRGFIHFSTGNIEELELQKKVAKEVIDNKQPFYIDGTSVVVLSEIGLLKKVYNHIQNVKVPQSVVNLLIDISGKFSFIPGHAGHMGYAQGKIVISPVEQDKQKIIHSNLIESLKLLESKPENIKYISLATKADCLSEQKIPAELCDACILAQKENIAILTEDFLYLKMNELETNKKAPEYFSSIILIRVLYEQGKINFEEYLDFFGYLTSYRFRFLSLTIDDIEKAVFGDGTIKIVKPENIRKFNFMLTLSEEYGVKFEKVFTVIGGFLFKIMTDDTIIPEISERIFVEIIDSLPTKIDKKIMGKMLVEACSKVIEKNKSKIILHEVSKITQEKVDRLQKITDIFKPSPQILTLN